MLSNTSTNHVIAYLALLISASAVVVAATRFQGAVSPASKAHTDVYQPTADVIETMQYDALALEQTARELLTRASRLIPRRVPVDPETFDATWQGRVERQLEALWIGLLSRPEALPSSAQTATEFADYIIALQYYRHQALDYDVLPQERARFCNYVSKFWPQSANFDSRLRKVWRDLVPVLWHDTDSLHQLLHVAVRVELCQDMKSQLSRMLHHSDPEVREVALTALRNELADENVKALFAYLAQTDPSPRVREDAKRYLERSRRL